MEFIRKNKELLIKVIIFSIILGVIKNLAGFETATITGLVMILSFKNKD